MLSEGVAEGLGPLFPYVFDPPQFDTYDFLFETADELSIVDYAQLAMLTRFLIEQHGTAPVRSFFRTLIGVSQPEQAGFAADFAATFDISLDDTWSDFISEPRCPFETWYCDVRGLHEDSAEVNGLDCSDSNVMGFMTTNEHLQYEYHPFVIVHLHVTETRAFDLEYNNWGWFTRCGTCLERQDMFPWPEVLEEGIYAFILPQYQDAPLHFSIKPAQ